MRAAAVALLLALIGIWASGSALARKGGGQAQAGGKPHGAARHHAGGKPHHHGHHHHGHHHHHKGGVAFVGFGFAYPWYPPYYYPYYPYYPQPVAYPAQPVTYIEQGAAPAAEPVHWWYYCESARAYYPYVRECPAGWQRVPALPPPPN